MPSPPHIIPWYALYSRVVDAVWLRALILRHAEEVTAIALHLRAVEEAEAQREVLPLPTMPRRRCRADDAAPTMWPP